ncbi:hypothetical protein LR48_Vigan05g095100 [Vigna angularis]|uniref:Uncharacterized protein n=1 Tax=Phaseolus angularis TaxID=3914 RepID=A0A0L9UL93_PHAAN|nr:hypothetical protein LR48_Vigan05g095100 [Vigna angularis]
MAVATISFTSTCIVTWRDGFGGTMDLGWHMGCKGKGEMERSLQRRRDATNESLNPISNPNTQPSNLPFDPSSLRYGFSKEVVECPGYILLILNHKIGIMSYDSCGNALRDEG